MREVVNWALENKVVHWVVENKEWLFSGLGITIIYCLLSVFRLIKKSSKSQSGRIVFTGKHKLGENDRPYTTEVFYPEPFDHTPHLTVEFPIKRWMPSGSSMYPIDPHGPACTFIQQRPDGFIVKIESWGDYKPYFNWKAQGVIGHKKTL